MQGAVNCDMFAAPDSDGDALTVLTDCHLPQDLQQLTLLGFIFQGPQITEASITGLQLDIQVLTIHRSILLYPSSDILDNVWVISHSCQSVNLLQTEAQCKTALQSSTTCSCLCSGATLQWHDELHCTA